MAFVKCAIPMNTCYHHLAEASYFKLSFDSKPDQFDKHGINFEQCVCVYVYAFRSMDKSEGSCNQTAERG